MASSSNAGPSHEPSSSSHEQSEADEIRQLEQDIAILELQLETANEGELLEGGDDDDDDDGEEPTSEQLALVEQILEELTLHTNVAKHRVSATTALYSRAELFKQLSELRMQVPPNLKKIQEVETKLDAIASTHVQNLGKTFADTFFENSDRIRTRFENIRTLPDARFVLEAVLARTLTIQRKALGASEQRMKLQNKIQETKGAIVILKQQLAAKNAAAAKKAKMKKEQEKARKKTQKMSVVTPRVVKEKAKRQSKKGGAKIASLTDEAKKVTSEGDIEKPQTAKNKKKIKKQKKRVKMAQKLKALF